MLGPVLMPKPGDGQGVSSTSWRAPFLLPLLFTILTVAIGGVTWRFYVTQKEIFDRSLDAQLTTTVVAKVRQLSEWRRERLGQAQLIASGTFATDAIQHLIAGNASIAERSEIQERLDAICAHLRYAGAVLVNNQGIPLQWAGRQLGDTAHLKGAMEMVLREGQVVEGDFDLAELPHPPHLGLRIPLRAGAGQPIIAGLLLSIDPQAYMAPLLEWPVPSQSADVILLRREADAVLFLTATRTPSAGPLRQRVVLTRAGTVEVMAAMGRQGTVQGLDYRGVPVYAALRSVPGTPWFLIAKIDESEAMETLRRRTLLLGVTALSLILSAGALVLFLWRREQLKQYRTQCQAETTNRRLAEQYSNLSRMVNDVILLMDADGVILNANDRVATVYGYSPAEIQGMQLRDLRTVESGPEFTAQWDRARECGSLLFETVHRRKDGTTVAVEVSTRSIPLDGKSLQQSVIRDISDRRRAERKLSETESRFREVVENSPFAILVVRGSQIRYANPEAIRLFGAATPEELTGRPLLDRVVPEQRSEVEQRVSDVMAGLHTPTVERRYRRLNGEPFWTSVSATKTSYDGQPAALLFIRDITEAKAADEERARLEEQLRHAVKMESVGRLAGGVAHDFNNYLTVINGYCDMLLANPVADGELRDCLTEIRAAGERAASVTQQLLTFSRKQISVIGVVDLNQVVIDSDHLLRRLIGEDLKLTTRLQATPATVMADPAQMGQVLMNLVVNARDAMPGGGGILVETTERVNTVPGAHHGAAPGSYVVLSVTDTGVGIDPEVLASIFEPFFTTKGVGSGTGLGLSTAYGIARQSGGWIDVRSAPGEGTRFEVWLPWVLGDPSVIECVHEGRLDIHGDETLLVVEDQAEVRRLTLSILKAAGYCLLEAGNAQEALLVSAAHPGRIDLLVTDVIMPGLNGRQLAERLVGERPELKVLYMSGYSSNVVGPDCTLPPGVEYLRKPFGALELGAKVRDVLERVVAPVRRILVIDDDASVRGLLAHILRGAGHTVVEAEDGKAGLVELQRQPVDLVITDLVMPEQEGLDVLCQLRAQRPELPVIAISGAFGGSFLKIAAHLGAAATLAKPVDAGALLAAVRTVMSARDKASWEKASRKQPSPENQKDATSQT